MPHCDHQVGVALRGKAEDVDYLPLSREKLPVIRNPALGASFESRHAHNAYSMVSLDVMAGVRCVTTVQYKPTDGAFSYESNVFFPFEITKAHLCSLQGLGKAIETNKNSRNGHIEIL